MQFAHLSATERRTLPPAVAVSSVAFALEPPREANRGVRAAAPGRNRLWIPLVRRTRAPYRGLWALPGGPTEWNETLVDTADRTLRSACRREPGYLEQLYAFGGVERSATAQRLVTIAFWALLGHDEIEAKPVTPATVDSTLPSASVPEGGKPVVRERAVRRWDDPIPTIASALPLIAAQPSPAEPTSAAGADSDTVDANVAWFPVDALPRLAFDHEQIVAFAWERLKTRTAVADVAHRFLGPTFTLARLRAVHEAVLGTPIDPANFRRRMLSSGNLIATGERETGTRHRPAALYRFRGDPPRRSNDSTQGPFLVDQDQEASA